MATAALTLRKGIENRHGKPPENNSPAIPVHSVPIPTPLIGDRATLPKQGCLSISMAGPSPRRQAEKSRSPHP